MLGGREAGKQANLISPCFNLICYFLNLNLNLFYPCASAQIRVAFFLTGSTGLTRLKNYSFPLSGLGFSSFIRKEEKRIKILQNPVNPVKIKKD